MANPSALKVEGQRVTNPDGDGKVAEAAAIEFDNTTSGLAATDVQAAIDEIAGAAPDLADVLGEGNDADGNSITNLGDIVLAGTPFNATIKHENTHLSFTGGFMNVSFHLNASMVDVRAANNAASYTLSASGGGAVGALTYNESTNELTLHAGTGVTGKFSGTWEAPGGSVTGSFAAGQVPVASGTGSLTSNAGFTREVDGNGFDAFNLAQHTPDRDGPRVNVIGPNPAIHLKSPGGDFLASWQYFEGDSSFPSFSNIGSGFLSDVGFNAFGEWPELEDVSTGCSVGVAPDDAVQFTIEDEASEAWAIEFASTDGRTVRTSVSIDVTAAGGDHHMIDVAVWAVKSAGAWSVSHTIVHDTSGGLIDIDVIDGEDNGLYVVVSNDLGEDINAQLWIGGFFANMPAAPSA